MFCCRPSHLHLHLHRPLDQASKTLQYLGWDLAVPTARLEHHSMALSLYFINLPSHLGLKRLTAVFQYGWVTRFILVARFYELVMGT